VARPVGVTRRGDQRLGKRLGPLPTGTECATRVARRRRLNFRKGGLREETRCRHFAQWCRT